MFDSDVMGNSGWVEFRDFVCNGDATATFFGDNRESASCSDPSFWPIHPTLDRALHAKLLAGGFESTDWPSFDDTDDTNLICEKNKCYLNDVEGKYYDCCVGHYEGNEFPNWVEGSLAVTGIGMTNGQYMTATDASSKDYQMPYIYDSFSWSHCSDSEDDDVDGLLALLYADAARKL